MVCLRDRVVPKLKLLATVMTMTLPVILSCSEADGFGRVYLSHASIALGEVSKDSTVPFEVNLSNESDEAISDISVKTSCGCIVSERAPSRVASGGAERLSLRLVPATRSGQISEVVFVSWRADSTHRQESAKVAVSAVAVDGNVVLDPAMIVISEPGELGRRAIRVRRRDGLPIGGIEVVRLGDKVAVCSVNPEGPTALVSFEASALPPIVHTERLQFKLASGSEFSIECVLASPIAAGGKLAKEYSTPVDGENDMYDIGVVVPTSSVYLALHLRIPVEDTQASLVAEGDEVRVVESRVLSDGAGGAFVCIVLAINEAFIGHRISRLLWKDGRVAFRLRYHCG